MTKDRWIHIAGFLLVAGGLAWLLKLGVIVATNGRVTDTGAAGMFYLIGVILLLVGSTGLGMKLAARRNSLLRTVAVILSPIVFVASFLVFQAVMIMIVGDWGPTYVREEAGIFVAAVVWLLIGVALLVFARRRAAVSVS